MPSIAENLELPPEPSGVTVNVTQTRLHVFWDSPLEGDDSDDGDAPAAEVPTDEEIAFFQVQVADDVGFTNIVFKDRMVRAHHKTFRVHKPKDKIFYARVRSVDDLGNKSAWISNNEKNAIVPTPATPRLQFKRQTGGSNLKAIVTVQNVVFADEDISRYQFALRETDFAKLTEDALAGDGVLKVDEAVDTPSVPFDVSVQNEDMTVTNITGANNLNWHVTRGVNGTVDADHVAGKKVFFFGTDARTTHQTVTEEDGSSETGAVFRGCEEGARYRARVRAIDAENRKSGWSDWCNTVRAKHGADSDGAPGVDEETPTDWPYERALRIVSTVATGLTSDSFSGIDGTITAARIEVGVAPTANATIDVNVNAVSVLTCTIPAGSKMSELTWVDIPGYIGKNTGHVISLSDVVTVVQTDMADAAGGFVAVVLIYLNDGTT